VTIQSLACEELRDGFKEVTCGPRGDTPKEMTLASLVILLTVIALTAALTFAGRWMIIPEAVLLTIAGIALGFVPMFPSVRLDPSLVLLVMLPPLVYYAAVELP
jgi:NhaP-type Na+/H+ or K+/H+ antiporter